MATASPVLGNGNEDGLILDKTQSSFADFPMTTQGEPSLVFIHLSLAKLADCCNPTPATPFYANSIAAGVAYPQTKTGFGFGVLNISGTNSWWFGLAAQSPSSSCGGGNIGDYLVSEVAPCDRYSGVFTPSQAQKIDQKTDDGIPSYGKVRYGVNSGGDNRIHYSTTTVYDCLASSQTNNTSSTLKSCNLLISW